MFRRLIEMNSRESTYYSYLGLALMQNGWNGYVQAEFKVALHYNPYDEIALAHYNKNTSQKKKGAKANSGAVLKSLFSKVTKFYNHLLPKSRKVT